MQLMEGKTFHPQLASQRCNRIARWHKAVGCGLLASWLYRLGIQLSCLHGGPHEARHPGSFSWQDGCVVGKREVLRSWVLHSNWTEISSGCSKGLQAKEIFLSPHSWDIIWIILFTSNLMWRRVSFLIYIYKRDNVIVLRNFICSNEKYIIIYHDVI